MEDELHKRVIGQHPAIEVISKAIRRSRAGLKDPKRPTGSFVFLGPSGVGKTELARTLAEFLFGDEDAMVRIDMSEYMEKHAGRAWSDHPRLTSATTRRPADRGGAAQALLRAAARRDREGALPDVFNILLQILEDGRLTDSQGRTVDFRHAIVIMTSNIGAQEIARNTPLGFAISDDETGITYDDMKNRIMGELKKVFRPEFLNRIDDVIVFHKLQRDENQADRRAAAAADSATRWPSASSCSTSPTRPRTCWSRRGWIRRWERGRCGAPSSATSRTRSPTSSCARQLPAGSTVVVDPAPEGDGQEVRLTS